MGSQPITMQLAIMYIMYFFSLLTSLLPQVYLSDTWKERQAIQLAIILEEPTQCAVLESLILDTVMEHRVRNSKNLGML